VTSAASGGRCPTHHFVAGFGGKAAKTSNKYILRGRLCRPRTQGDSEMEYGMAHSIGILGTGAALPETVLTNQQLATMIGIDPEWIPHQANIRIIETAINPLKVPSKKVYVNLDRYGNTSSASIPIALDEVVRLGILRERDLLVLVAFGAGLTWGATVLRW
jgi:3-Oxoacyl-[acyl-carrier-protein (ACP)] synthase III C terminal